MGNLVTKECIEKCIKTKIIGRTVIYKEEVDSTSTEAKRQAEQGACHGLLVTADTQNAGKGRRGRSWSSPKGSGIWMSFVLKPEISCAHASMLTLVAALSVTAAIREVTGLEAMIKWPNDIVVHGKKVCGILTEMKSEADGIRYVIVGIGINANVKEFPKELTETAGSLLMEGNKTVDRCLMICRVLEFYEAYYESYLKTEDLSNLMKEYNLFLVNYEKTVKILEGSEEKIGIAKGIDKMGALLVEISGEIIPIVSGEVSVRGLYGYV